MSCPGNVPTLAKMSQWDALTASVSLALVAPSSGVDGVEFIMCADAVVLQWLERAEGGGADFCEGDQRHRLPESVRTFNSLKALLDGWWPPARSVRPAHWPAPKLGEVSK